MGIPLKKFLYRYFGVDDLSNALGDIGEKVSGNKDELVTRLVMNWESHNRNIYDLLDYLDKGMLADLCKDYNIDYHGDENLLRRRIRTKKLLEHEAPEPSSKVDDPNYKTSQVEIKQERKNLTQETKSSGHRHISLSKITAICIIIGTIIAVLTYIGLKPP